MADTLRVEELSIHDDVVTDTARDQADCLEERAEHAEAVFESKGQKAQDKSTTQETDRRTLKDRDQSRSRRAVGIEGAASHLVTAGVSWLVMSVARAIRAKQKRVKIASAELDAARAELQQREAALESIAGELQAVKERQAKTEAARMQDISTAASEVSAANAKCQDAAAHLETTMNDLRSTQEQLTAARTQLQAALDDLANARQRGEVAEGELGLTRSENELLKRELQRMTRQLEAATNQMEKHRAGVRHAHATQGRDDTGGFSHWEEDGNWSADGGDGHSIASEDDDLRFF